MNEVHLVVPSMEHEEAFNEMLIEFENNKERMHPGALRLKGLDYTGLLKKLESYRSSETCPAQRVPSDTYFLVNEADKILGAVSIRHYLNEELLKFDGNIGYGVRPSERRKGYGKTMLKLALDIYRNMGMSKVLVTCNKDNIPSAKTIIACSGVFENELAEDNGNLVKRYWIDI